jgi:sphinganine-1-phosphate aldolase
MKLGESGYINSCREIVGAARQIETGIRERFHPDLFVMGEPIVSIVAFSSKTLNIYELADEMNALGWNLNALQSPPAVHIECTKLTIPVVDSFLKDLETALQNVKLKSGETGKKAASTAAVAVGDTAALYGIAGSLPNKSIVKRMAIGFIDTLYKA